MKFFQNNNKTIKKLELRSAYRGASELKATRKRSDPSRTNGLVLYQGVN